MMLSFNPVDLRAPVEQHNDIREHGSEATKLLWEALKSLKLTLKLCTGLRTFSVFVDQPGLGFFLPRPLLGQLLFCLPGSCENIEIDTGFSDRDLVGEREPHLCTAISAVLPQLKHLRLHLNKLCSDLLEESSKYGKYPNLESLIVDCCHETEQSQTTLCNFTNPAKGDVQEVESCGAIVKSLNKLHFAGFFPNGTHVLVIGTRVSDKPVADNASTEARWHSYVWRNIIAGHTRLIPYHILGFDEHFNATYVARIGVSPQHDIIGSRNCIRQLARCHFWQQSLLGSRFPSESKNIECTLAPGKDGSVVVPKDMAIDDRRSWREKGYRNMLTLWLWEDTSGEECLTGVIQQDVERDPVSVFQKVPAGWREVDAGAGIGATGNGIEPIEGH